MNGTLIRALLALLPVGMLLSGAIVWFRRGRTLPNLLQLVGATGLLLVVFWHLSEALHWFPRMQWGLERSYGHYVDMWSALLGLTLFPLGYLLHALKGRFR
ncbi:MAG TPA: hypothetical protein VK820_10265 [Steroidobacteraceae bacterium]|jgi:hypothetical protein|nr:hypothetical protein [Steroidobacteraceae bacterium]